MNIFNMERGNQIQRDLNELESFKLWFPKPKSRRPFAIIKKTEHFFLKTRLASLETVELTVPETLRADIYTVIGNRIDELKDEFSKL